MIEHPRDQDLVLATHGRSFYIMDDITPLQQLTADVLAKSEHLFRPRPSILWLEDKQSWHGGGDDLFRAKNPPDAVLSYFLRGRASTPARIQILDATGRLVRELDGSSEAGLHRVSWDLRQAPSGGTMPNASGPNASGPNASGPNASGLATAGLNPSGLGDRVSPGTYVVKLLVNGRVMVSSIEVEPDPGM